MGKTTSNRPKPSKTFQKRPNVPQHVLQRIIDLKNRGMGFIRISKRLKKEGIATLSKSTVANCWYWAQRQNRMSVKKLQKNPALKTLAKKEVNLRKQLNQIQTVTQARQRVRDLQLQRAETPEGRQEIFRNSEELKEFVQQTLYDSQALEDIELYCETECLALAKTLSQAVGSLDKYEEENEDMFWPDLSSYIAEQIDNYLEGEHQRKKQDQLQKEFSDFWLNFRCKCGTPYYDMYILKFENVVSCRCRERFMPKCLECGNRLVFDDNTEAFVCKECNFIFRLPGATVHYTFLREGADFIKGDSRKDTSW